MRLVYWARVAAALVLGIVAGVVLVYGAIVLVALMLLCGLAVGP